jgi:putative transposase
VRIKLHRRIEGRIKTCTIKRKNGKYYACFSCEVEPKPSRAGRQVGVDLGVKHLAVISEMERDTEEYFDHPKYLRKAERRIRFLQRMVSRRKKGSNRRRKAVAMLAKVHEYIANQRRDTAHKVSRYLVDNYDLIAFEDLNIQGMVKNHRLSRSILDAGWRMLVEFTAYKAEWAGKQVVTVDPRGTSQVCSECGRIVKKTLSERIHRCECGYVADRDVNAAKNILQKALGSVHQHQAWTMPS